MKLRMLIKKNARTALRRHWCRACAIALIMIIFWAVFVSLQELIAEVFGIAGFVDIFSTPDIVLDDIPNISPVAIMITIALFLLFVMVITPLKLGVIRWFYLLTDGKAEPTISIFEYFFTAKGFFKAVLLRLSLFVRRVFWSVIFLAPPIAMISFGILWGEQTAGNIQTVMSASLKIIGCLLFLLLGLFLSIWLMRYYLAEFMLVGDNEISVGKAISRSIYVSQKRKTEFLVLELSLLGWRILDMLILPRLFTVPYITSVKGLYARYLSELVLRGEPQDKGGENQETEQSDNSQDDKKYSDNESE